MASVFIYVEVKNFAKYIKCRSDVEEPSWFKLSNDLLDDDDLHEFTGAEICAWIHIMSLSSKQQNPVVRINLEKIVAFKRKFRRSDLLSVIGKLSAMEILTVHESPPLRTRNVDVPPEERGRDGMGQEESESSSSSETFEGKIGLHPDLAGNSEREQVLPLVSKSLQDEWVKKYDPSWLKNAIVKAISHYRQDRPANEIADWQGKLVHWFTIEKKPKLRAKPPPPKPPKEPPKPWPTGKTKPADLIKALTEARSMGSAS